MSDVPADVVVTLTKRSWSYFEDCVLWVRSQASPFHHEDRNTLIRIADPVPNPLMRAAALA